MKIEDNESPHLTFVEQAVKPATPAVGNRALYFKTDNKLYVEDEAGTETEVGAAVGTIIGATGGTDNVVILANGTGGVTIQASPGGVTIDDSGSINIPSGQTYKINGSAHTHAGGGGNVTFESAYASPPGSPASGDLWMVNDIPLTARHNGSSWSYRWLGVPVTLPPNSSWTWFNQGSATLTDFGIQRVTAPTGSSGDQLRGVVQDVTAPYTVYLRILGYYPPGAAVGYGICARKSSDGKLKVLYYQPNNGHTATFEKWNSGTSYSGTTSNIGAIQEFSMLPGLLLYRIKDDNTNFSISISPDNGVTWFVGLTETRTTFATCDQVGFFAYTANTNFFAMCELGHWLVTA